MTLDYAALDVDGTFIDAWTAYSFVSDLFTPADAFRLSLGVGVPKQRDLRANIERIKGMLPRGKEVKLWIGAAGKRALQAVCVIEKAEIQNDADSGTTLVVEGRDRAVYLTENAADPKLYEKEDTLISVARRACTFAQLTIEVTADHIAGRDLRQARVSKDVTRRQQNKARAMGIPAHMMSDKIALSINKGTIDIDEFVAAASADLSRLRANRLGIPNSGGLPGLSSLSIYQLRVKEVRPQSGETRWEYLDRQAKRNGLLMRMSPDGKLVFCGLQYQQAPSYRFVRRIEGDCTANNILSGGWSHDISSAYRTVKVYGRVKGEDVTRSPFVGIAEDKGTEAVPFEKTLMLHDNTIKSKAEAQTRAEYELGKSKQGSVVLSYTLAGHSSGGLIVATDTVAHVEDHVAGINAPFYVTSRTFARNPMPTTEVRLVPLGAIVLREAA
jgi:prophage tail gpP-like protein